MYRLMIIFKFLKNILEDFQFFHSVNLSIIIIVVMFIVSEFPLSDDSNNKCYNNSCKVDVEIVAEDECSTDDLLVGCDFIGEVTGEG